PLDGGWIDFEPADARGEGIAGYTLAVADRDAVLRRAHELGLDVAGHGVTLSGTRVDLRQL
ncbi:MAG TPA: hypothetical protein PLO41_11185, partial [Rubrivivax sp.]|nr:hypothetical protein [Rubrivivax sp.]